jgi:DNA-binding GntR family transcriptional regulator
MADDQLLSDVLISRMIHGATSTAEKLDERSIGREFRMPRAAVRSALSRLAENGILRRARKVGTSLAHELVPHDPALITRLPHRQRQHTRGITRLTADRHAAELLETEVGRPITRLERILELDGQVLHHWTIWTLLDPIGFFGEGRIPDDRTWYEVVAEVLGDDSFEVERRWTTMTASREDARLLDVPVGAPMAFLDRTIRDSRGRLLDRSFCRGVSSGTVVVERSRISVDPHTGETTVDRSGTDRGLALTSVHYGANRRIAE